MTTETDVATQTSAEGENKSWGPTAMSFAGRLASEQFERGDLAALRRMDPDDPAPAAIRLMAERGLLDSRSRSVEERPVEEKWALILHGIALMTRTSGTTSQDRTAHSGAPVGRVLFQGDGSGGERGYYSPSRFNRLMAARGPMFRTLLIRMFRTVAAANQPFNWYQMAELIQHDGLDEPKAKVEAKRIRQLIAGDYYQAEVNAAPKPE